MATSSKKLKVENFQRQRERMEGSLVQNEEDQPKEEKVRDETSSNNTSNTSLDTSKKGGKPVGDPRVSGDAEGQYKDEKHKSLGKSESDTNDSILEESGVVRLQRAARAELQRRHEKALEDAAAAATVDDEEKATGAKLLPRGRKSRGGANDVRRNPSAMGSANAFDNGMAAQSGMTKPTPKTSAINSSWMQKASRGPDEADESKNRPIISLDQLNRNIEKRLNSRDTLWDSRASLPRVEGTVKPPVRDTMSSLLSYNHIKGDWRGHQSASTYNVAVVFGKPLVRDQITVEYSSRIRTLARLFKNNPLFRPSLICFTGCIAPGNHVSNADAGYIFFRHMCEAQGIDLEGVDVLIDSKSRDETEAVYRVTEGVKKKYIPRWLEGVPADKKSSYSDDDAKKIAVHFSLVSTEYHLCNLNDVHHRSPRQSLLKPIEAMADDGSGSRSGSSSRRGSQIGVRSTGFIEDGGDYFDEDDWDGDQYNPLRGGNYQASSLYRSSQDIIVETSWSFQYATYPFLYAQDEAVVFLGKCFLLAEELMPLLVNMKGVVEEEEFFQRDNYLMLASIRRSLVSKVERLHKSPGIKRALKRYQDTVIGRPPPSNTKAAAAAKDIIVILEGALLSLGRCVDLVRPAGLLVSVVPSKNWQRAISALKHSLSEIRSVCDPDRPLRPTEWGKLVDEEDAMLDIGYQKMNFVLWKERVRETVALDTDSEENDDMDDDDADGDDFFDDNIFTSLLDD